MEQIDPDLLDAGQQLFEQAQSFLRDMIQPWQFYQTAILLALFGAAHLIRHWLGPRLLEQVRANEGWPRWRLRGWPSSSRTGCAARSIWRCGMRSGHRA